MAIDSIMRELWGSASNILAHLNAQDPRFGVWSLKSGHISYHDRSAHLRFKNVFGRTRDASISLASGFIGIDEQIRGKLLMLVD